MKSGIELMAAERARQVTEENYSAFHDDKHIDGVLSNAAMVYVESASIQVRGATGAEIREAYAEGVPYAEADWPFTDEDGEYVGLSIDDDPIRNLVKAGALCAAEIDRIIRERSKGGVAEIRVPKIKRFLDWKESGGQLAKTLCSPERNREIESFIGNLVEKNASLQGIITALNERGDLSDGEWTAAIFALGHFDAALNP